MKEVILLVVLILLIIILILIWHLQNSLLFQPSSDVIWTPDPEHVNFEDVMINNKIHAWYIHNFENRPVVIYCHGNTGNISYREYVYVMCQAFQYNLVLYDYRGFGKSKGYATQRKICDDGLKVYDWVNTKYECENIIVWGESLGGAVASEIASKNVCKCLVLFSTFSSLDDVITQGPFYAGWLKIFAKVAGWLIDTLPSKDIIGDITDPVLILHSTEDDVIPISNAHDMFNRITHSHKKFLTIKGGHVTPDITVDQFKDMYCFIERDETATISEDVITKMIKDMYVAAEPCRNTRK